MVVAACQWHVGPDACCSRPVHHPQSQLPYILTVPLHDTCSVPISAHTADMVTVRLKAAFGTTTTALLGKPSRLAHQAAQLRHAHTASKPCPPCGPQRIHCCMFSCAPQLHPGTLHCQLLTPGVYACLPRNKQMDQCQGKPIGPKGRDRLA
jgi:hypothetical protein